MNEVFYKQTYTKELALVKAIGRSVVLKTSVYSASTNQCLVRCTNNKHRNNTISDCICTDKKDAYSRQN